MAKRKRSHRPRKGVMPPALKRYWATHRRKSNPNPTHHAKRRHGARRRRNAMPPALAKYWRTHRRGPTAYWPTVAARRSRRRRNPILGLSVGGFMGMLKDSALQALGSVAIDLAYGQVNKMLPATMQVQVTSAAGASTVGVGDAIKAVFTVAVGTLLSRPTRGLSRHAAVGSLTVQLRNITESLLPATIVQQLAWATPSPVHTGHRWVGPNRGVTTRAAMAAYTRHPPGFKGGGPLLSAYTNRASAHARGFPLLTGAPGLPNIGSNVLNIPAGIPIR
jgi:hypothetical protein